MGVRYHLVSFCFEQVLRKHGQDVKKNGKHVGRLVKFLGKFGESVGKEEKVVR